MKKHDNEELEDVITELCEAISDVFLGSKCLTAVVIDVAGAELISNWNDHLWSCPINTGRELAIWKENSEERARLY